MIRVLHTSDLHGQVVDKVLGAKLGEFDVWFDSGDFFPDLFGFAFRSEENKQYQKDYAENIEKFIVKFLDGKPFSCVAGNHDSINLARFLNEKGHKNCHEIKPDEVLDLCGLKVSGFPHVNFINGCFYNEAFSPHMDKVTSLCLDQEPDTIVVHAPPFGVMDKVYYTGEHIGNRKLTNSIVYNKSNNVKRIFCGHVHSPGHNKEMLGIDVFNGATQAKIHEIKP